MPRTSRRRSTRSSGSSATRWARAGHARGLRPRRPLAGAPSAAGGPGRQARARHRRARRLLLLRGRAPRRRRARPSTSGRPSAPASRSAASGAGRASSTGSTTSTTSRRDRHGQGDLVLAWACSYHLRDPLLSARPASGAYAAATCCWRRRSAGPRAPRGSASAEDREPLMEFTRTISLYIGDHTNWRSPNPAGAAGDARVGLLRSGRDAACTPPGRSCTRGRIWDEHRHDWRTLDGASTVDFDKRS